MGIGLGLFFGFVVVGLVYLYVSTKEQWNWSKIIKRTSLILGGLFTLFILLAGGFLAKSKWWDARPLLITQLVGVSIGEKLTDVFFKHGDFKRESKADPNDKSREDYENTDKHIFLTVKDGTVRTVLYDCQEPDYKSMNGIACGDSGETIKEKFGERVRILCGKEKTDNGKFVRVYDVVDYGTRYFLHMNKVVALLIATPKDLQSFVGLNWDKCE